MPAPKKTPNQMLFNGVRVGRVMDIEAVLNKSLVRDVYCPGVTDLDLAVDQAKREQEKSTGSDFLPLVFHVPVCIAVGKFQIDKDNRIEWTAPPQCMRPEFDDGTKIPHEHPTYVDALVRMFWASCERWGGSLITFNGRGFDFPVLELHAIRLGIVCPKYFEDSKNSFRHRYGRHIDIMDLLSNYGAARRVGKLDVLLKMMGLPGKGEVHGADVLRLWDEKRFADIEHYCIDDVMQTFEFFRRVEVTRGESGTTGSAKW